MGLGFRVQGLTKGLTSVFRDAFNMYGNMLRDMCIWSIYCLRSDHFRFQWPRARTSEFTNGSSMFKAYGPLQVDRIRCRGGSYDGFGEFGEFHILST